MVLRQRGPALEGRGSKPGRLQNGDRPQRGGGGHRVPGHQAPDSAADLHCRKSRSGQSRGFKKASDLGFWISEVNVILGGPDSSGLLVKLLHTYSIGRPCTWSACRLSPKWFWCLLIGPWLALGENERSNTWRKVVESWKEAVRRLTYQRTKRSWVHVSFEWWTRRCKTAPIILLVSFQCL